MSRQIFLLDVDGVLRNFVQGLIDWYGWTIAHDDYADWNYHRVMGVTDQELLIDTEKYQFVSQLKAYAWSQMLLDALHDRGDVVFCTNPGVHGSLASAVVYWLREQGFMAGNRNDYCIGPRKELAARSGAILIDDSDVNVNKYRNAGGRAVTFPQPWNGMAIDADRRRVERVLRQVDSLLAGVC